MKRDDYLEDQNVSAFIAWFAKSVTGKRGIAQSWSSNDPRGRNPSRFRCQSLYEAYKNYEWDGQSFEEVAQRFDEFRGKLEQASSADPITYVNMKSFFETAKHIVQWSCTDLPSLVKMRLEALAILNANAVLLDLKSADTEELWCVTHMGATYSKIYSAMIDDFPIYDSRVGCALTSLIKQFCEENDLPQVPKSLRLGIPPSPEKICRDPSDEHYQFTTIEDEENRPKSDIRLSAGRFLAQSVDRTGIFSELPENRWVWALEHIWSKIGYEPSVSYEYADSNLKAAWILGKLADIEEGDFSKVCRKKRVRALEAALFMIGYQPLRECAVRKGN